MQEYVKKTYASVTVTAKDGWMRLDIDNDGSVSVDDLRKSMQNLYQFLKDFDMIEATTSIRCKIYSDAIKFMQK